MLYSQTYRNRTGDKVGIQSGRNHDQVKSSTASIMRFHLGVVIVPQLAYQKAASRCSLLAQRDPTAVGINICC
jgi:hypothetical protein